MVYAFTHMCDEVLNDRQKLAIGIFPKIMVRALVIMMVYDDFCGLHYVSRFKEIE